MFVLLIFNFELVSLVFYVFFFKQKTAYEMRISDWSSDVCSSDLTRCFRPCSSAKRTASAFHASGFRQFATLVRRLAANGPQFGAVPPPKIGRASCRERVCQYV